MQPQNDAIADLLAQYDLGDTGGDPGSTPVRVVPQQQRPAGIPATKAVPPKDPVTGKFLPAQVQPSAASAQHQVSSEDPLLDSDTGEPIQHSRTLLRHALQSGFTDQEIDSTPSEQLQELVFSRQREQITRAATHNPTPNISANETPVAKVPEPEPQVDFVEIDKVLDPEVANPLKAHLTAQLKQLKAIEAKLEAAEKREQQRVEQQRVAEQSNHLDRLLSKHSALLGEKPWHELTKSSPDWVKRHAVLTLAEADTTNKSVQEKIDWAVSQLFGTPQVQPETTQGQGRPTAQDFANGGVPRPTQRKPAPEINDVKRARQAVQQQLERMSQPGQNGTVELDDFPE